MHLFMLPKWATADQEVFLEDQYAIYQQLKYRKKRALFKEFWISLMADWSTPFGGTAADNGNETEVPSLKKVSCQRLHNTWNRQRLTNQLQRLKQWFNNRSKGVSNSYVSPMKARSTMKLLKKKKRLQLWQAVVVLNYAALKEQVDKQYTEHLSEVAKSGGKPMSRLRCLQLNSLEFYAESAEATQEDMKKHIQEDTIDAPEYLLESQDMLGEEEMK